MAKRMQHCFWCGEELGVYETWPGDIEHCHQMECVRQAKYAVPEADDEIERLRQAVQHESDCVEAAKTEIERLRAALEEIVRESNGVNKGALAQKLAIDALAYQQQARENPK